MPVPRTRHPVLLTFLHTHITRSARHLAVGFVDYEVGAALCRRPTTLSGKRKRGTLVTRCLCRDAAASGGSSAFGCAKSRTCTRGTGLGWNVARHNPDQSPGLCKDIGERSPDAYAP